MAPCRNSGSYAFGTNDHNIVGEFRFMETETVLWLGFYKVRNELAYENMVDYSRITVLLVEVSAT